MYQKSDNPDNPRVTFVCPPLSLSLSLSFNSFRFSDTHHTCLEIRKCSKTAVEWPPPRRFQKLLVSIVYSASRSWLTHFSDSVNDLAARRDVYYSRRWTPRRALNFATVQFLTGQFLQFPGGEARRRFRSAWTFKWQIPTAFVSRKFKQKRRIFSLHGGLESHRLRGV